MNLRKLLAVITAATTFCAYGISVSANEAKEAKEEAQVGPLIPPAYAEPAYEEETTPSAEVDDNSSDDTSVSSDESWNFDPNKEWVDIPDDEPEDSSEPDESSAPDESSEPNDSSAPDESSAPDDSSAPDESSAPDDSSEPDDSSVPDDSSEPEIPDVPDVPEPEPDDGPEPDRPVMPRPWVTPPVVPDEEPEPEIPADPPAPYSPSIPSTPSEDPNPQTGYSVEEIDQMMVERETAGTEKHGSLFMGIILLAGLYVLYLIIKNYEIKKEAKAAVEAEEMRDLYEKYESSKNKAHYEYEPKTATYTRSHLAMDEKDEKESSYRNVMNNEPDIVCYNEIR